MGDTKEKQVHRGFMLTRIITAALTGLLFLAAITQILFFQDIKVSFQTGIDAQQISTIKMKKGTKVELPTPMKPGSYFKGWSLSPDGEILEDSTELMKDTTLYARWDGAEKYVVLSVDGLTFDEINIFETRIDGLTAAELNERWRVPDDYSVENPNLKIGREKYGQDIDPFNSFSRFLGWQYLNANSTYNDLLYNAKQGTWTWIQRNADNEVIKETLINDTNKFYPPNYRTTFTALLDYRTINIQLFDKNVINGESVYEQYTTFSVKLGEENITLPVYDNNPNANFSHWEIRQGGSLKDYINAAERPELAASLSKFKKRYESGEVLDTMDSSWYYFGNTLLSPNGDDALEAYLIFDAVYWDNNTVNKYTVQSFTDLDSGTNYVDFGNVRKINLSAEEPVAYDPDGNCFWLYYDQDQKQIASYAFYDHNGNYHVFNTSELKKTTRIIGGSIAATEIKIGDITQLLGEDIYFNDNYGINIMVNYTSGEKGVTVKFNYNDTEKYEDGLYMLPNYDYFQDEVMTSMTKKIGDIFKIYTGEKYMKPNCIFIGWQMKGDDSGRIYNAGESFTIPNFNTKTQSTVIEFVALWYPQRLLFDFDFDGGSWRTEDGPDYTLMKGAYGDTVRIVDESPVKFGYNFIGWTLEDDDTILKPRDYITVGTKFQTLHAHWEPKRLHVTFYKKYDASGNWAPSGDLDVDIDGNDLYAGRAIALTPITYKDTSYYIFKGWQIGNRIVEVEDSVIEYTLTTQVLSQLKTVETEDNDGAPVLEVYIYASQIKRTLNVDYDYTIEVPGEDPDIRDNDNIDVSAFVSKMAQGDYFYDYYPFSVARNSDSYAVFDMAGRQFKGWMYSTDNGFTYQSIDASTRVPTGYTRIMIRGSVDAVKLITVEYYNHLGQNLRADDINTAREITLPSSSDEANAMIPSFVPEWGTFVGWGLEPDNKSGNPKLIYDVYGFYQANGENPRLKLLNHNDTIGNPYAINIDRYAEKVAGTVINYKLKLYTIYSNDYATITYENVNETTYLELNLPVYSNGNYDKTNIGGRTVGYDLTNVDDFAKYGVAVLDDNGLQFPETRNFVGWVAELPDGVSATAQSLFVNKIWFSGEYLPSFDFSFSFKPIIVRNNTGEIIEEYGYHILSLSQHDLTNNSYLSGTPCSIDILVLPRGNYTLQKGSIIINSDREVHVIIPAEGNIILEPGAIQCNTIREFYVGDNLTISGSPVVGDNFQAYRVKKGCLGPDNNGTPTEIINSSDKYDFIASVSGLLLSKDQTTLYGVPSHTNLTANALFNIINQSVTHIKSYAFTKINSMTEINLAKATDLQIDAYAIYNGNVQSVILPASVEYDTTLRIDPQAISGALSKLRSVTFGDATTTSTWYAFVDSGFIYYVDNLAMPGAKTHVVYALQTVRLNSLTYVNNNLPIETSVTKIEPYALAGLDWNKINSLTANNDNVDLRNLQGIPAGKPRFTSKNNSYKGEFIQPLIKTFWFTHRNGNDVDVPVSKEFEYGQTFRVFSAQNNNYGILFNRPWAKFAAWSVNGTQLKVGRILQVGIDEEIVGDQYEIYFDASLDGSWISYPVRFVTYHDSNTTEYLPEDFIFSDVDNNTYTVADLIGNDDLNNIYLPALDQKIANTEYQFIGWSTKAINTSAVISSKQWSWNDANNGNIEYRILPNKTSNAVLTSGISTNNGVYVYYALYEKATPNIEYNILSDGTYAVVGFNQITGNNLNIPFAKYHDGYMVPITKINDNVFSGVTTNNSTVLTEISIGGAVSEIGQSAFSGVKSTTLSFKHKGRSIYFNYQDRQITEARHLKIGNYAFSSNSVIENLVLPAAVETLGTGAFQSCIQLATVSFEKGYSPFLRRLGDFVFADDQSMQENAIVSLLVNDGENVDVRFENVGNGIFMHTKVKSTDGTNKIVWRDTLLHTYYPSGYDTNLSFNEKIIAGYAFADLGSDTDSSLKICISFIESTVQIKANAFSKLHTSVDKIRFDTTQVDINKVNENAFDMLSTHEVNVYTRNKPAWDRKFRNLSSNIHINGSYS